MNMYEIYSKAHSLMVEIGDEEGIDNAMLDVLDVVWEKMTEEERQQVRDENDRNTNKEAP